MESGLRDKVVFVTGASGGIGRAVAETFASEGARLALQGRSQFEQLQAFVAEQEWADRSLCLRADVSRREEISTAMEEAVAHFGRVDVCVANAGIWPADDTPFHELSEERLRRVVDSNLMGVVFTAQVFLGQLARLGPRPDRHGASLVFTGSTAGRFGERDHADYSMTKAAMYGLVRSLKNEIARIDPFGRVNMVEPGWTVTHMARPALAHDAVVRRVVQTMSLRQLGRAVDIARSILYLSSPILARHVSGEVLTVAGGMEGRLLWADAQIDVEDIRRRLDEA